MDVENMHPFCLPFGLCHDATSSMMTVDFDATNNNNLEDSISSDRMRCNTLTPSDDFLFKQTATGHDDSNSLLFQHHHHHQHNHDDLIDSGCPKVGGDSIYSLECDIDIDDNETDSLIDIDNSARDSIMFGSSDQDVEIKCNLDEHEVDSWYCSQFSSLFSPPLSNHHHLQDQHQHQHQFHHLDSSNSNRKKSLIRMAINNQVFHHLVDPLDIKSSPTLAQLNLNSNDDPSDSLWTGDCMHNCTSINNNNNNHNHNHTSTTPTTANNNHIHGYSGTMTGTSDLLTSSCCNSTGIAHHHHHHLLLPGARHLHHHDHNSMPSICSYLHHHHSHSHSQSHSHNNQQLGHTHPYHHELQLSGLIPTPATCRSEATSYSNNSKKHNPPHQLSPCCQSHSISATAAPLPQSANAPNQLENNSHIKPSSTPGATHMSQHMTPAYCSSWLLSMVANKHCNQQLRSASPALVTSSSSPLSSTENKQVDNKLKENIDYLTALLCNGNKQLDTGTTVQTSSISSTMVRSYATLAHSLSSSSKLLETSDYLHQLPVQPAQPQATRQLPLTTGPSAQTASTLSATAGSLAATNEASPQETSNSQQQQMNLLKRCYNSSVDQQQQQQWFKSVAVESSVSAADSTDGLNLRAEKGQNNHHHCHGTIEGRQIAVDKLQQQPKQTEHKVLSSLLSTNKCSSSIVTQLSDVTSQQQQQQQQFIGDHWQEQQFNCGVGEQLVTPGGLEQTLDQTKLVIDPNTTNNNTLFRQQPPNQQVAPLAGQEDSIPINGKPITLKPHSNHNGIIVQQKPRPLYPPSPLTPITSVPVQQQQVTALQSPAPPQQPLASNELSSLPLPAATPAPAAKKPRTNSRPAVNKKGSLDCASQSSHDEGFLSQMDYDECASQRDSDGEDDIDSDDESFYGDYSNSDLIGASISDNAENKWTLNMGRTRRNGQKRYFWQYNVQSKGPKGTRMCSADDFEDPFVLPEASDPVFSNDCQVEGVKHSGKARRGDGNDLTPNPRKLLMIGLELKKLGKIINELAPVIDLPMNARNKTRKEKNKLASRACRLKKKAQHEANKIKLYGLQREHQQVVMAIYDVRKLLNESLSRMDTRANSLKGDSPVAQQSGDGSGRNNGKQEDPVSPSVQKLAEQCSMTVAGQTSDYVNSVLEKVVSGFIDGGLQI